MDPIHPILPQPLNIPPVTPPPRGERIDRDTPRDESAKERERQRRRRGASEPGDDEDDQRPHVDVTA